MIILWTELQQVNTSAIWPTPRRALLVEPDADTQLLCDRELRYLRSHVGGVSIKHSEQWDHFVCPTGCGRFEYRVRTRRLLKVAE